MLIDDKMLKDKIPSSLVSSYFRLDKAFAAMLGTNQVFRKLMVVNADTYSKQKLVVADEKCLPIRSF